MGRLKLCSVTAVAALIAAVQLASRAPVDQATAPSNRGVVELETSGAAGISVGSAEGLATRIDAGGPRRGHLRLAVGAGKPAALVMGLEGRYGLPFLAVPFNQAASSGYAPTRLTAADYPSLVPQGRAVDTVAVGSVLAVAELKQLQERYRNVANFVDVFFTGFQTLQTPGHHPKWQDVNLAADLPGWHRFAPAEQWLQRNMQIANAPKPEDLRRMFASFIDEHRHSAGGAPMTDKEK